MEGNDVLGGFSAVFEAINKQVDPSDFPANLDDERVQGSFNGSELPGQGSNMDLTHDQEEIDENEFEVEPDQDDVDQPVDVTPEATSDEAIEGDDNPVSAFFDAIAEAAGWEVTDDSEKPKTAEDLVEYMKSVVENNKVEYADPLIGEIDEYVRAGGTVENYLKEVTATANYDNIDLSNEHVQRSVVREFLSEKGFTEQQIQRKLEKYEDADILEDEAADAVESLKEIKEEKRKALLEGQKKSHEEAVKEQQKFYNNVVGEVEALTDIRGIQIPKADKQSLMDYIFKVDSDGRTKYQKDYASSLKNLIESAYFTMKGDALISTAKKSGETSAVEKLKNTLNSNKVSGSKQRINNRSAQPLWSVASSHLLRRPQ